MKAPSPFFRLIPTNVLSDCASQPIILTALPERFLTALVAEYGFSVEPCIPEQDADYTLPQDIEVVIEYMKSHAALQTPRMVINLAEGTIRGVYSSVPIELMVLLDDRDRLEIEYETAARHGRTPSVCNAPDGREVVLRRLAPSTPGSDPDRVTQWIGITTDAELGYPD